MDKFLAGVSEEGTKGSFGFVFSARILKMNRFHSVFELDFPAGATLQLLMITSTEDCQGRTLPFPPDKRVSALALSPKAALRRLTPKDSVLACAVLTGYVALYIGVGFAGLELLSWAWTKLLS